MGTQRTKTRISVVSSSGCSHSDFRKTFLEKKGLEKLTKAVVSMSDCPDPRYIPHLYCTILGSVIGPIGLRRLSMELGCVEFLNTLFEVQTKMVTEYDLYLWRHWIWLYENSFEVEGTSGTCTP
jgi:hypothetical protein